MAITGLLAPATLRVKREFIPERRVQIINYLEFMLRTGSTTGHGKAATLEFSRADARAFAFDCGGDRIELDGSELILCVKETISDDIVLQHLEIGYSDSPVYINVNSGLGSRQRSV